MARPVKIEVEASLGDTLVKLALAKKAVEDLGHAGSTSGKSLAGDKNSLENKLGLVGTALYDLRKATTDAAQGFGDMLQGFGGGLPVLQQFGQTLTSMAPILGVLTESFAALGALLVVWPALVALVTFAVTALVDVLGILVAVVADLTGPLALVGVMLGGLGLAVGLAAKEALSANSPFTFLKNNVSILQGEFAHLVRTLAGDFMPIFVQVIKGAQVAVTYFGQLAKMPLSQAFQSLSTTGVFMFEHFAEQVGATIGPILRLAIQTAFAPGPIDNVLSHLLGQVKTFLFGSGASKRGTLGNLPIGVSLGPQAVSGALQPFIDWWNRHDFTKQGLTMAEQIIHGVTNSSAWANFKATVVTIAGQAGSAAGHAFVGAFESEITGLFSWMTSHSVAGFALQGANYLNRGGGGGQGGVPPSAQGGSPGPGGRGYLGKHHPASGGALPRGTTMIGEVGTEGIVTTSTASYVLPGRPGRRTGAHHGGGLHVHIHGPVLGGKLAIQQLAQAISHQQRVAYARSGGDW